MASQSGPDNHSAGLTVAELAAAKGLPEDVLHSHGLHDDWYHGRPAVAMEYRTAEGTKAYDRFRIALTGDRFRQPAGVALMPYGLDKLMTEGNPASIVLCEGETDALTCWYQGIPALGIPGASSFQDAWAQYIDALVVYVIQEPDVGGQTLVARVGRSPLAHKVMVVRLPGAKDVNAFYLLDPGTFRRRFEEALELAEPLPEPEQRSEDAPLVTDWPPSLDQRAYHGLAGEIVDRIDPTTEADRVAVLLHLLAYFGNAAVQPDGWGPHIMVEATPHKPNEYVAIVGATSKARKGTAERRVRKLLQAADPDWADNRIKSGASSGEGLIYAVRDATVKDGKVEDPGEADKRLCVVESELATVLRRGEREGSSLSPILRDGWDGVPLNTLVSERSRAGVGAKQHHLSLVGHITRTELRRYLTKTEMANGLGNRFLFALVKRSKYLPRGAQPPDMADLVKDLHHSLEHARIVGELDLDPDALRMWEAVYPSLSEAKPGLAGEMVARGEAHALRLALLYALLDRETAIRPAHLLGALAVWQYCEDSVSCIFGSELGDPDADAVLGQLRERADGATVNELRDAFDRHWPAERLQRALQTLVEHGVARGEPVPTRGRPATRYTVLALHRPGAQRYVECALSVLSAESPSASSDGANNSEQDAARKDGDGEEADGLSAQLPRTFRAPVGVGSEHDARDTALPTLTALAAQVPGVGNYGSPGAESSRPCPYEQHHLAWQPRSDGTRVCAICHPTGRPQSWA